MTLSGETEAVYVAGEDQARINRRRRMHCCCRC
jgi:hypothetical protein